jgi:WD40 repeat protein
LSLGPSPANKLVFDPSSEILAVGMNDGGLHFISSSSKSSLRVIQIGSNALQSLAFDKTGESLVTSGSGKILLVFVQNVY